MDLRPTHGLLLVLLALGGCASTGAEDGVLVREPEFLNVLESGVAVAPVGHLDPVVDAAEVTALLSNELWVGTMASLPGTPLVGPDEVLARLAAAGDEAFDLFRAVRRASARRERIAAPDLTRLSRVVLHRYLLLTWVSEEKLMGLEEMKHDYTESAFANDVRRAAYEVIKGRIEGVVLDLWEGGSLWRGAVDYETQRLFGDRGSLRDEIERTRADAADRFALLLGAG